MKTGGHTRGLPPRGLTVDGLEIPMDDGNQGSLVKVVHALCNLHCPVDQEVRRDLLACQGLVEGPSAGIFHHQAEVGRAQANRLWHNNGGVAQHGKQRSLLAHVLH